MNVLGIESSCDETAVAIVNENQDILANLIYSQTKDHQDYIGVVPEIAARAHLMHLDELIKQALMESNLSFSDLDAVAVTGGPGLIGGVIVGVMTAKAIAAVHNLPFIAVNHLEGHVLSPRLIANVPFPYLSLLVSGGHSQILISKAVGHHQRLATTLDDAVGETFDKTAKILGLGYPGGPEVEKWAKTSKNPGRFNDLPRPMLHKKTLNFSLSGLKTAVRIQAEKVTKDGVIDAADVADLCAGLQRAIKDILCHRVERAIDIYLKETKPSHPAFVVSGGVAANQYLRDHLQTIVENRGLAFHAPPLNLCSDNAAMIAWAGLERLKAGKTDDLYFKPRPRWPLDQESANTKPALGETESKSGVKA